MIHEKAIPVYFHLQKCDFHDICCTLQTYFLLSIPTNWHTRAVGRTVSCHLPDIMYLMYQWGICRCLYYRCFMCAALCIEPATQSGTLTRIYLTLLDLLSSIFLFTLREMYQKLPFVFTRWSFYIYLFILQVCLALRMPWFAL